MTVVFLQLVRGIDLVDRVPLGHIRRTPSGGHKPDADLVPPAPRTPGIADQEPEMLHIDQEGIPGPHRAFYPVHRRLRGQFRLESTEQLVPDDQDLPVIAIQVTIVHGVMHPVMAGGNQHRLQHAHLADQPGMIPELGEQMDRCNETDHLRRHTTYQMAQDMADTGQARVLLNLVSFDTAGKARAPRSHATARAASPADLALLWDHVAAIMADDGIECLAQPADTVVDGYYTDPRFGVEGTDAIHKNAEYGARILSEIYTRLKPVSAKAKPEKARRAKTTKAAGARG